MNESRDTRARDQSSYLLPLVGYGVAVGLLTVGSLVPGARVWGINWWAYLPAGWLPGLAALGVGTGAAAIICARRMPIESDAATERSRRYSLYAGVIGVVMTAAFVVFRAQTHFLGDGYHLLSWMEQGIKSPKTWQIGIEVLKAAAYDLVSSIASESALRTFQVISIGCGVGVLAVAGVVSRYLFATFRERLLFFIGVVTGGYMLQFFGYVENYAPMLLFLMVYTLMGVAVVRGRLSRYWAIAPFVAAVFFHWFAAAVLPSLLYLLLRNTSAGRRAAGVSRKSKWMIGLVAVACGTVVYGYVHEHWLFIKFLFLPVVPTEYTVEGNWLFAPEHFVDMGNLLFMLVPGLPVFIATWVGTRRRKQRMASESVFLLTSTVSTGVLVFLVDPGLGFARDWDLMALVGIPPAVFGFYGVLRNSPVRVGTTASLLAIAASLLVLGPRVASQAVPEIGVAHFRDYLVLDKTRNRNARQILIDYYYRIGDTTAARNEIRRRDFEFPELRYNEQARRLINRGQYQEAIPWARRAMERNPLYYDSYFNLGGAYLWTGRVDSGLALLKIADAINPYNAATKALVGYGHILRGDTAAAEDRYLAAYGIDSTQANALAGLVMLYLGRKEYDRAFDYLGTLHRNTTGQTAVYQRAAAAFQRAGRDRYARQAMVWAQQRQQGTDAR